MRKIFITYCDYPLGHLRREIYEKYTKPRFIAYCDKHGFEFIPIMENIATPRNLGFAKVFWIKQNMANLADGDVITYMDIDCCIMDGRVSAIFDADFSIVRESTGCLCMGGTWSVKISDWSRKFIEEMCSEERHQKSCHLGSWNVWHENDAVYHVLGLNWGQEMTEMGTRDTTPFTKEEIFKHVKILPVEWGVTYNPNDTNNPPNYYKTIAQYFRPENYRSIDDTIVRHLSASSMLEDWAEEKYFKIPMKI
jgi:hypothetical protein